MTYNLMVEMSANPFLTTCFYFIHQNGGDRFGKTPSSEHRQKFKHTLNNKAAQGGDIFLTITGCNKTIKMSTKYVGYYKDMQL